MSEAQFEWFLKLPSTKGLNLGFEIFRKKITESILLKKGLR